MLVETDGGVFFTKLLGAAQAPASLVAEIIVSSIAEAIGLQVPGRVLVDIPSGIHADDPHAELAQLLRGSIGRNLGFAYLQDARTFQPADLPPMDPELAATILWLDGFVQNPDRTAANANLLWSQGRLWLIDHGASLGFQHRWRDVTEDSPRARGWPRRDHVMWSRMAGVAQLDTALAAAVTREVLETAVDEVPHEYLGSSRDTSRRRAAYAAFLWKRLKEPRPFLE